VPTDASHDDPLAPNAFTNLRIRGVGVPPYSARGVSQTLEPIDQAANLMRDANGGLDDISFDGFKKYKTTVTGSDQRPPNFNGKWPGLLIEMDCISELVYATDSESPDRPVVPGSEVIEGAHTAYRPRLQMRITGLTIDQDEYGAQVSWTLTAEEV
jgi:hypothetical protein